MTLLHSQIPHARLVIYPFLGADCSPELHGYQNSNGCIVLSCIVLRNSAGNLLFFSKILPRPDLDIKDLPFFSQVRSFAYLYALLLLFLFRRVSLRSYKRSRTSLVTNGFFPATFIPKYLTGCIRHCYIVGVIMVIMSMSSSFRPMSGENFPPIFAWKVRAKI